MKQISYTFDIGKDVSFEDFERILFERSPLSLSKQVKNRIEDSFHFLSEYAADKLIYGVNTGFGPMAQYQVDDKKRNDLQYNLIRSHCMGTGEPLPPLYVRAALICRLNSMIQGYSGIHPELASFLLECLNKNILPLIFTHGGVGASGDLVQLAHLAQMCIGEGEVWYQNKRYPAREVLKKEGIKPIKMHIREGLSLINGTSVMTGIAAVNLHYAQKLLEWSIAASSLINELVQSYDDHYSPALNEKKKHKGQREIASRMETYIQGSRLIKSKDIRANTDKEAGTYMVDKVQEYYSLRCVPQILGPVFDTLERTREIVIQEINSVSDNPIVDSSRKQIYHGGNFHGDYISFEMDKLKIAVTRLSMLSERQLNYILNPKLNEKFPPFLNYGSLGLNLGLQGMQFPATSTTAENQTLSFPNYVHSIPNNGDNQDIVSMGTNSAWLSRKVIDNAFEVLAIEWIAILYIVHFQIGKENIAPATRARCEYLSSCINFTSEDHTKSGEIMKVKERLMSLM